MGNKLVCPICDPIIKLGKNDISLITCKTPAKHLKQLILKNEKAKLQIDLALKKWKNMLNGKKKWEK